MALQVIAKRDWALILWEAHMQLVESRITRGIITSALEVHRALGPGLLESTYRACLEHQMRLDGLHARREVPIPIDYKGLQLECPFGRTSP
jgi:hypothetical protein